MFQKDTLFAKTDTLLSKDPTVSLHQIARAIGIDRHAIQKAVSRTTGNSFQSYQKRLKIHRVRELVIKEEVRTVKQLADRMNYNSPESFTRFIKQTTGMSAKNLILAIKNEIASNADSAHKG